MISVETKTKSSSPIESILPTTDKGVTLSFSELLKGVSLKKNDDKIIQNGLLVLSLADDIKNFTPTEISKNTLVNKKELLPLELNPQLTNFLSPKELRQVVNGAKRYLKNKIINSEGFKKSEISALPKTLKGLVQVAKKFSIDVSKITIQEIGKFENIKISTDAKPQIKSQIKVDNKIEVKLNVKPQIKPEISSQIKVENKVEIKPQIKVDNKTEVKLDVKPQIKPEISSQINVENKVEIKPQIKVDNKVEVKTDVRLQVKPEISSQIKVDNKTEIKPELKADSKTRNIQRSIETMPLFKAQASKIGSEITTQQLVNTKLSSTNVVTSKQKSKNTLKILLRGEKVAKKDTNLTADFSVSASRVIAPSAILETKKPLESLLSSDTKDVQVISKVDGLSINTADSFEVKLNEAKQMLKYISQDVKTAIQDYKSPFTRVKIQLNPQRLGEMDLTVVQRGKNLHISLSSNNVAINTLLMNANDLKVQLSNSGINNATLNFSNNSQSSDSNAQQQQNHQNGHQAREEYNYFDNEEKNEEVLSSLEIVVPHYA